MDEQNGFRPKRSCEDHIFSLTSIIKNRVVDGRHTFVTLVDFQKAFDCVNRNICCFISFYKIILMEKFNIHLKRYTL